jgi:hypothetical protein
LPSRTVAVVSCHVERPLDDRCWDLFSRLQRRRLGGFRIAALLRPPDPDHDEQEEPWLERAREAAEQGPLGLHTHWTSPTHARPSNSLLLGGGAAERVRREVGRVREKGLEPRFFVGGGWYIDEAIAEALAELGLVDCTATSFRPEYLERGAPRLALHAPGTLALPSGRRLRELPATHSLGRLARAVLRPTLREPVVHAYFHDTELLDARRRATLAGALVALGRRRRALDLDELARHDWPERPFSEAYGR